MLINYSTTRGPGTVTETGTGFSWTDEANALVDDSTFGYTISGPGGGGGSAKDLNFTDFGFDLPPFAVIDGITVEVTAAAGGGPVGSTTCQLLATGAGSPALTIPPWPSSVNTVTNGGSSDLWSKSDWTPADINSSSFGALVNYFFGSGVWTQEIYYVSITVNWHIDITTAPTDVPSRVDYKVYSREGTYLGLLPRVANDLSFSQDKNSSGSTMEVVCGADIRNLVTVNPLLTEDDEEILTEDDDPILSVLTNVKVAPGSSDEEVLFKNSNRIEAYLYNYYYPNGKKMFSGQVNRVSFVYGGTGQGVKLVVYSDGYDLDNYIARGYPFTYTTDVSQVSSGHSFIVSQDGTKGGGWDRAGQTFQTGGGVTNIGAITLRLNGTATTTVRLFDGLGGALLASVTQSISTSGWENPRFEFPQLITVTPSTSYFFDVIVNSGQSIYIAKTLSSVYANGAMYQSLYSGGSGGGGYTDTGADLYFVTASGTPTTTTTYSTDDPVTEMMSGILLDYNNRGGSITERDFTATGLSLTYTFSVATVFDAMKKVLELSPAGYYSYVDLGTAEMDIKQTSTAADYTVVKGKDIHQLEFSLSIEQVKNYLLFSGGDVGGGVNLYRDYEDTVSSSYYGLRTVAQTDNRVTLTNTADAIGTVFIEENAEEVHETKITILNDNIDITLLTPGTTLGFRNFDNFIDSLVLEIVRRDYTPHAVTLTLGRLPRTLSAEVQSIYRGLLNEQTLDNPTSPT